LGPSTELDPRAWRFIELCRVRGCAAWLVGGFVRDRLLGRASDDVDVVVPPSATELAFAYAAAAGVPCVRLHDAPPTLRIVFAPGSDGAGRLVLDVCGLRGNTIVEDLTRRDFTCNAMAQPLAPDASDALLDPLGGQPDLEAGVLRMAGPRAFDDDPLRLIRAFRLGGELGLQIEPDTLSAIRLAAHRAVEPAGERIRDELLRVLGLVQADALLRQMADVGVLGPIVGLAGLEASAAAVRFARCVAASAPLGLRVDHAMALAALLHGASPAGLRRVAQVLRLSERVLRSIRAIHRVADGGLPQAPASLARSAAELCADHGEAALRGLVLRAAARPTEAANALALADTVASVVAPRLSEAPLVSGAEVIALTGAQGAEIGRLLRETRVAQLAGELSDAGRARAWLASVGPQGDGE